MTAHKEVVIINTWVKILCDKKSPRKYRGSDQNTGDLIKIQTSFLVFSLLRREKRENPRKDVDTALCITCHLKCEIY